MLFLRIPTTRRRRSDQSTGSTSAQERNARAASLTLLATALALAALGLGPAQATAGTYVVSACGAAPGGVNNSWSPYASHPNVTAYGTPCAPISGGLIARAAANGQGTPANAIAGWTFTRPSAATVITSVDISAQLYRLGGDSYNFWGVGVYDNTGTYLWGGGATSYYHAGLASGSYLPISVNNRTSISIGIWCANGGGCTTASGGDASQDYSRARVALYGARVTLYNSSNPYHANHHGRLWSDTGWISGTQSAGFHAGDDIGIRRMGASLDGEEHASDSDCDYTRVAPCPVPQFFNTTFNTAGFADGDHELTFRSTDASGNVATESRTVHIDNTAPAAPSTPALSGAPSTTWRTVNGFTLTYANPSTAGGSPNASSDVEVCPVDGTGTPQSGGCIAVPTSAASGSNTFNVPAPGTYRARVRVNDELYTGAWSDWSPVLRFDDVVPGKALPQVFNGWLSREDLDSGLQIEPRSGSPRPASGFAGYAVTRDGSAPGSVATIASTSGGVATIDLRPWGDGVFTVRTRPVSVAGLAASNADVVDSTLRIDTTPPTVALRGAPAPGSTISRTVVLDVAATDSLSSMAAADDGNPLTTGGHITVSIDGEPETRHRGGLLRLPVQDGRHAIRIAAVDVAGNRSETQTITFTQDTASPQGGLLPVDPTDPRRLAFFVSEECIASGTVELSADGGRTWRPLDTTIAARSVTARIPDDVWEERVAFSVRARVTDCAGNKAVLDQWYGGGADGRPVGTLMPPQRVPVRLTAAFTRLELTRACVMVSRPRVGRDRRTGRTRIVRRKVKVCPRVARAAGATPKKVVSRTREVFGVLTDATGRALAGRDVHVQTQPKVVGSAWQTVRVVRTDRDGAVRAVVRKFTSLRIRLIAPRDESFDTGTSATLVTNVAARSTIHADRTRLRNGEVVRLSGRVQGGSIPSGGMQIALYGFSPSKRRWLPVRTTIRVDPRGGWASVYRFTSTGVRATYRFRVRIAERATFPFSTGYSRTVRVTVRP